MNFDKFAEQYKRIGFWQFWLRVLAFGLFAWGLVMIFARYVGPYVVGLWLTMGMSG